MLIPVWEQLATGQFDPWQVVPRQVFTLNDFSSVCCSLSRWLSLGSGLCQSILNILELAIDCNLVIFDIIIRNLIQCYAYQPFKAKLNN